ncbi:hypothetical protein R5M92_04215 [Halomonas sp. Bachu 37]|uniref:hypothetical protein n=1 Tax=Halomonas kashgarensis TaxID=3084920 RepID=UPI003216ADA0
MKIDHYVKTRWGQAACNGLAFIVIVQGVFDFTPQTLSVIAPATLTLLLMGIYCRFPRMRG